MAAKGKTTFVCDECGQDFPGWSGQCQACRAWNSLREFRPAKDQRSAPPSGGNTGAPVAISAVAAENYQRLLTTDRDFDQFFGGGLVRGGVTLFGGEPGVGKSTFILQLSQKWAENQGPVLYCSGEESAGQIRLRAERLGTLNPAIDVLATQSVDSIREAVQKGPYTMLIVDSIQTVRLETLDSPIGSISQLKASLNELIQLAKQKSMPLFVIGHINKDGDIAGPKLLEHLVDTVLYLEREENEILRVLRAFKNRYGTVDETLLFYLGEKGMKAIQNPGAVYLSREGSENPGFTVGAFLRGLRPILCEIQCLVKRTFIPVPKRLAMGFDTQRLQLLTAVLEKHGGLNFSEMEIYSNIVGGLRVNDTGIDVPVAAALISALLELPLPRDTFFVGEVGLTGEVRKCRLLEKRYLEARNLGFKKIVGPPLSRFSGGEFIRDVRELITVIKKITKN